jgi:ABC-2 type transport system ATP-binding protein
MIEKLHHEGMSMLYTTHYMEEAERLCGRIAIVDHGRIIALGTRDELVQSAFGSRSEVVVRFEKPEDNLSDWVKQLGGRFDLEELTAQFTIDHAAEIAGLLDAAAKAGYNLADVSLRKPTLESVFLKLTGRELRD